MIIRGDIRAVAIYGLTFALFYVGVGELPERARSPFK